MKIQRDKFLIHLIIMGQLSIQNNELKNFTS
jgi:hypothetical protein